MEEPKSESSSQIQSESISNEVTFKIGLNNEIKPKLIGKKTKRKWKLQAIHQRTSKKNKINDFIIRTCLELVNFKNNNIAEDEDGDRLNIRENNFPEVYCNRKFYSRGYSPHIIELEESLTRYNASFRNLETISTKCNSLEANGY
jgi:5-methylcytosine-specific restriction endonuclease McrA